MTELPWILQRLNGLAIVDIALVALVVFFALYLVRATQAVPLLRGLMVLIIIGALLGGLSQLPTFGLIMRALIPGLLVAIPVIFQPELRRALERLGRFSDVVPTTRRSDLEVTVRVVSDAAQRLAARNVGALMIVERETGLQDLVDTGVRLDARLTPELLLTIFHPNTALHDGGVIIRGGRVAAAGCVLPLTAQHVDDFRIGLRHRAGIGVTEGTDAIAVIISEERGKISIAHEGRLVFEVPPDTLQAALIELFQPSLTLRRAASLLPNWLTPKRHS